MLLNYLKIALRNILRNRTFSIINIIGLSFSMSVGLLIISMIVGMNDYDQFHINYDRIYRVLSKTDNHSNYNASAPMPLRETLFSNYEGIEEIITFKKGFGGDASFDDKTIPMVGYFCSARLFEVFDFKLKQGNPSTALVEPYSVVLTAEYAKRLF